MENIKRFHIQPEVFAHERIKAIREAVEELKIQHPEILSLNLFGSLVKGKTKQESDIDAFVYIDTDLIPQKQGETPVYVIAEHQEPLDVNELNIQRIDMGMHLRPDLYDLYGEMFPKKIKEKIPDLTERQLEHIVALPMAKESLNILLDRLIESRKAELAFWKEIEKINPNIKTREAFIKMAKQHAEIKIPKGIVEISDRNLANMFLLEVGGGIRKYRKILIDRLLHEGEVGEKIWNEMIMHVETWEQKVGYKDLPTQVHYPRTLVEAKRAYA